MFHVFRLPFTFALFCLLGASFAKDVPNFTDHVAPIFKSHCNSCHNPDKKKADLDLTTHVAILLGGSGGEVVKAGIPDTSYLVLSIEHAEDVEPMPPKKPKIPQDQIDIIRDWIRGGLLPTADGKSAIREVSFDLSAGSAERPDVVAIPTDISSELTKVARAFPINAIATSPWAPVVAVAGHEQVVLFGESPPAIESPDFEPVAQSDLVYQNSEVRTFDGSGPVPLTEPSLEEAGKRIQVKRPLHTYTDGFAVSLWVKPGDVGPNHMDLFGFDLVRHFLERRGKAWTFRSAYRTAENDQIWTGRVGTMSPGQWTHIALVFEASDVVLYQGGQEISRHPLPKGFTAVRDFSRKGQGEFVLGGLPNGKNAYRGSLRDIRIYQRPLTADQVAQISANAHPSFGIIGTLPFPEGTLHSLIFSPNGSLLVAAGGRGAHSGKAVVFDVATGERKAEIGDEQDAVLAADISPDHSRVAIGGPAKVVKVFSAENGKMLYRIEKHTDWITALAFSPDGQYLASGDRNGGIYIWEAEGGGIAYTLDEHKVRVTDLSWRPDAKVLASGAEDGNIVLWDMSDGFPIRSAVTHKAKAESRYTRRTGVVSLEFTDDGGLLTAGRDGTIRLWKSDGAKAAEVRLGTGTPTAARRLSGSTRTIVGQMDGSLAVYDLTKGALLSELPRLAP